MKRNAKLRTALWIVCAGAALRMTAAQEDPAMVEPKPQEPLPVARNAIVKAGTPIVIDGRLDDADWKRAGPISACYVWGKEGVISDKPRMKVRYLWDDAYLYVGYEVFDTNLVARGDGTTDGPPGNRRPGCEISDTNSPLDVAEFMFVFEDRNFFWEVEHNALNQFHDLLTVVGLPSWHKTSIAFVKDGVYWAREEHIWDEGDRTFACAVALSPRDDGRPSTVNDGADSDAGYTGELRFPWFGIGAPLAARTSVGEEPGPWKMDGREISILAICQNGDTEERYFTTSYHMPHKFFVQHAEHFPRYVLKQFSPLPW